MTSATNLRDRLDIVELVHRYFACLDAQDAPGLADCVDPDLVAEHSLIGTLRGRDAFLAVATARYPGLRASQHYCSNEQVRLDGDLAECRAYLYAQHEVERGSSTALLPGGGRYTLELERHAGRWWIHRLRNEVTWMAPGLEQVFRAPTHGAQEQPWPRNPPV